MKNASRREFLRMAGLAAASTAIAACATPTPQVIKEAIGVERPVKETATTEKPAGKLVKETIIGVSVDQSGKIGDVGVPTVLAFSNGTEYAILIPAAAKRICLQELRQRRKSGTTLYLQLFSVSLFLLLKDHIPNLDGITIDTEYPGQEAKVKGYLLNLLWRSKIAVAADKIQFRHIGKGSLAHDKAYQTYRGAMTPDRTIAVEELLREFK